MVRILVGTLLEVGSGKRKPADIMEIIEKKDRSYAGKTVPGHRFVSYGKYIISELNFKKSITTQPSVTFS